MPALRVLIVEDDRKTSSLLVRALQEEGYRVDLVEDGGPAIAQCYDVGYDVVVLDWMLPSIDGLSVCRTLRSSGSTASILMLTARSEVQERIAGLDAGADDFLSKPFDLDEVLARVRALGRRSRRSRYLEVGALRIDRLQQTAVIAGRQLDLTSREFRLLHLLASQPNRIVAPAEIIRWVWQPTTDAGGLVEGKVRKLCVKLGRHAVRLETVRGSGYRWRFTD